jgi:3D-(3,5/4)-trihydroxycyclohexane-1,2-dione acylhydrolase (decyclizing)
MGYEIAGALGAKMADPDREIYSMVGDGSWLMLSAELLTAVQERIKLVIILIDNHGFGSIAALSDSLGSQAFGTRFRYRNKTGQLAGSHLPIDFVANARSLGAQVLEARSSEELRKSLKNARDAIGPVVVYVEVDPAARFGGSGAWWDVPVAEVSEIETTQQALQEYEQARQSQRQYLGTTEPHSKLLDDAWQHTPATSD